MSGGGMITRMDRSYLAEQHMDAQKQRVEDAWRTAFSSLPAATRERLAASVQALQDAELAHAEGKLAFESLPKRSGAAWERHINEKGQEVDDLLRTLEECQADFALVSEQIGERLRKIAQDQQNAALEIWETAKAEHEAMVARSKANVLNLFWLHEAISDVRAGVKDRLIVEQRADEYVASL